MKPCHNIKKRFAPSVWVAFFWLCVIGNIQAATIGFVTSFGTFRSSTGAVLSEGGVSIGYFTVALPTVSQLEAMLNPWTELAGSSYGYRDVRVLLDSNNSLPTFQGTGTWDFSVGGAIGGTLNVPNSPSNVNNAVNVNDSLSAFLGGTTGTDKTTLWAFAFNKGNYANGFSGFTEWAAVTATAPGGTTNDWIYPGANGSENIQLSQINAAGEVLIGLDGNGTGITGVGVNDVLLIPEPSVGSFLLLGGISLAILRAQKRKA